MYFAGLCQENKKLKNLGWKITKNLEEGIKELINK